MPVCVVEFQKPCPAKETEHGPQLSFDRLEDLVAITDSSYTEIISNAIQLYEASVKEMEAGGRVLFRRKDGTEVEAF